MKAILISDHAKWCSLMMNGDKTVEVRKGTALYKATQKLIDEYGYANIYVYCTKGGGILGRILNIWTVLKPSKWVKRTRNGKVIFKFRCYKVGLTPEYDGNLLKDSCLTIDEFCDYLGDKIYGCAIHISNLEIFDKPKELSEFRKLGKKCKYQGRDTYCDYCSHCDCIGDELTKAPQSFCYIEVGE